jgi:hypothetical protein
MYHVDTGAYRVALHLEGVRDVTAIAYRAQEGAHTGRECRFQHKTGCS